MKEMPSKKIVLPTDFSPSARNAVHYAVNLYGLEGVEYILLNCYSMPHNGTEMLISLIDILRLESEEGLEKEQEELIKEIPGLKSVLRTRSENGYLENVLNRMRRKEAIDLVIMGTTGSSGMRKVFWGSNTASVLKRVNLAILAVPSEAVYSQPASITLALQQNKLTTFRYPSLLKEIIEDFHSEVSVISVDENDAMQPLVKQKVGTGSCKEGNVDSQHYTVLENDPVNGILSFMDSHPTNLLVMVARNYGFVKNLFHHSSTREMAMISKVPLLVIRERV